METVRKGKNIAGDIFDAVMVPASNALSGYGAHKTMNCIKAKMAVKTELKNAPEAYGKVIKINLDQSIKAAMNIPKIKCNPKASSSTGSDSTSRVECNKAVTPQLNC